MMSASAGTTSRPCEAIRDLSLYWLQVWALTRSAEGYGGANGSMAEAVDLSFRHLDAAAIAEIVTYLRSVRSQPDRLSGAVDPDPAPFRASDPWSLPPAEIRGLEAKLFAGACASCDGWSGQRLPNASLGRARSANDPDGVNALRTILEGDKVGTSNGDAVIPGFRRAYSNAEVATVTNDVIARFGGR